MMTDTDSFRLEIAMGIPENLPPKRAIDPTVDHAPVSYTHLTLPTSG